MDQFIQIKCPFCGAVLKVKQQAGLERASITCPVCKKKSPFSSYESVVKKGGEETEIPGGFRSVYNSEETQLPGGGGHGTNNERTQIRENVNSVIGCLVEKSGKRWPLHPGVNTVGRKTQSNPQSVEIPVTDYYAGTEHQRKMSRSHAKIEVTRLPNGSYKHVLYNWQNQNPTYVGGESIDAGDRIVLNSGATVRFANIDVRFVIDDPDSTTL